MSGFDDLCAIAAAVLFGGYVLRCVAGGGLLLLGQLPGRLGDGSRRLAHRVTPTLCRRAAAVVIGLTAAAAGAGPAGAAVAPDPMPGSAHRAVGLPEIDRGPLPSAAVPTARPTTPRPTKPARPATGNNGSQTHSPKIQVRRGDCLWTLAARQLGPSAGNPAIDRQWRRWYQFNRERIGADPDLIRTGMWLRVPAASR